MSIALDLARLGLGRTSPNPAVGCVIAHRDKILATGFHKGAGLPHAEAEALRKIDSPHAPGRSFLKQATLYLNLEPCAHFGRTPPCTEAILQSGIRKVVIGMKDPDPKVRGRGIRILQQAGLEVRVGVLAKECRELNQAYVTHRLKRRPYVFLKMAMTLEGMIGWKGRGPLSSALQVTGREAQLYSHGIRDQVDAILVGVGTVLADNPRLTTRLPGWNGKDPTRILLDSYLRAPLKARIFNLRSLAKTVVVSSTQGKVRRGEALYCPLRKPGEIDLKILLRKLADRGVLTLLVEGGPRVWSSFLQARLVDKVLLFVGTERRHRIPERKVVRAPSQLLQLPFQSLLVRRLGSDLFLEGTL